MLNRPTVPRTMRPSAKIVLCNTEKMNYLTADSYLLTLDVITSVCLCAGPSRGRKRGEGGKGEGKGDSLVNKFDDHRPSRTSHNGPHHAA
jgi:hypothetical protein